MIDLGQGVRATCNQCRHAAMLDLSALRQRLGPDHGSLRADLVPLLRCKECRSKDASITIVADAPTYDGGSYARAKGV